jgi:hypothetical protein
MMSVLVFVAGAAAAMGGPVNPLLTRVTTFSVEPNPVPTPSQGRVPVGLRLVDRIRATDGSDPPPVKAIRMELDKGYGLHLAKAKRCPPGVRSDVRTREDPCKEVKFGTGMIAVKVAFPEQQAVTVTGRAIVFKPGPGEVMIRTFLSAPVTGVIAIPIAVERIAGSRYGLKMTAAVPKIAGGYGSITSLDIRFRKGMFSAACSQGDLRSGVTNFFASGSSASAGMAVFCGVRHRLAVPETDVRQQPA